MVGWLIKNVFNGLCSAGEDCTLSICQIMAAAFDAVLFLHLFSLGVWIMALEIAVVAPESPICVR